MFICNKKENLMSHIYNNKSFHFVNNYSLKLATNTIFFEYLKLVLGFKMYKSCRDVSNFKVERLHLKLNKILTLV